MVLVLAGQMAEQPKSPQLLSKLGVADVWSWSGSERVCRFKREIIRLWLSEYER